MSAVKIGSAFSSIFLHTVQLKGSKCTLSERTLLSIFAMVTHNNTDKRQEKKETDTMEGIKTSGE
jgi:hypothetical protein